MVVAMAFVWMMQMAVHQVVDMAAVRHGLMAATGPVLVIRLMPGAAVAGRARIGIRFAHLQRLLVEVVSVRPVQMAVVQIGDAPLVDDGRVAAALAMDVGVVSVDLVAAHRNVPA
ncbi:MAG: hypothetical protein HY821_24995 [Acidobacteria bacterium]|nr:hypothetical protein [Acidobacteriota bacterium]